MSWVCELTEDAKKDLGDLPKAIQKRVARVLAQMETDPFQGNVKALKGDEWKDVFRRRSATTASSSRPTAKEKSCMSSESCSVPIKRTASRYRPAQISARSSSKPATGPSPAILRMPVRVSAPAWPAR